MTSPDEVAARFSAADDAVAAAIFARGRATAEELHERDEWAFVLYATLISANEPAEAGGVAYALGLDLELRTLWVGD